MPRETWTAPAALPLFSTSGPSRTSTTSVLPLAIISRASAGVIRGTAALAASIICLTLVAMTSSSLFDFTTLLADELRSIRFATRYHTSHGAAGGRANAVSLEMMVAARIARTVRGFTCGEAFHRQGRLTDALTWSDWRTGHRARAGRRRRRRCRS